MIKYLTPFTKLKSSTPLLVGSFGVLYDKCIWISRMYNIEICWDVLLYYYIEIQGLCVSYHNFSKLINLTFQISPKWLSLANLRKKEYLKLNRNYDTNIVLSDIKNKINELKS